MCDDRLCQHDLPIIRVRRQTTRSDPATRFGRLRLIITLQVNRVQNPLPLSSGRAMTTYQLALTTPGISPASARRRKQIRQRPNLRM